MKCFLSFAALGVSLITAPAFAQQVAEGKKITASEAVIEVKEGVVEVKTPEEQVRKFELSFIPSTKIVTNEDGEQVIEIRALSSADLKAQPSGAKKYEIRTTVNGVPTAESAMRSVIGRPVSAEQFLTVIGKASTVVNGEGVVELPEGLPEEVKANINATLAEAQARAAAAMKNADEALAEAKAQQEHLDLRMHNLVIQALSKMDANVEVEVEETPTPSGVDAKLDLILERLTQLEERVNAIEKE